MKKTEIIYIIFLGTVAVLGFTLGQHTILEKKYTDRIVESFPSMLITDEFKQSPLYSMFWIRESSWIDEEILLVKAEQIHEEYGYAPCFAKALMEVKKKYNITARTPLRLSPVGNDSCTDGLLLELEPKK